MTEFPAIKAMAIRREWAAEPQIIDEVRQRAGIFAEYDNEFEAQRLLREADELTSGNPETLVILTEAQARATLHLSKLTEELIEAQRLGNLIVWSTRPGFKPSPDVQAKIQKGLGL